jgi:hypothetical protein
MSPVWTQSYLEDKERVGKMESGCQVEKNELDARGPGFIDRDFGEALT